jgi:hypothetical protein
MRSLETLQLADLMYGRVRGGNGGPVSKFIIVDCRFPYEFEGGHVLGAVNLWTEEQITATFTRHLSAKDPGLALIFYCEFSSYRSPRLYASAADGLARRRFARSAVAR